MSHKKESFEGKEAAGMNDAKELFAMRGKSGRKKGRHGKRHGRRKGGR
jgi:hypothetical protein